METGLILAALLFGYALISRRLESTPVTAPMIFVFLGLILGPWGIGAFEGHASLTAFKLILQAALVLVLFTDAASISSFDWRHQNRIPVRLLAIGLPLSIGAGWLVATLVFPDLPVWQAAALGAMLAPTDAALGQAVIANVRVPRLIRQSLNIESGLNDGLALPFVTIFLAFAAEEAHAPGHSVPFTVVMTLLASPAIGLALGWGGTRLLRWASARGWVGGPWAQIAMVTLAFTAFFATDKAGGSGFIAAWVAGFVSGRVAREALPAVDELGEDLAAFLGVAAFLSFGTLMLGKALPAIGPDEIVYAILSLTLVRMIPVGLSLAGTGLRRPTKAYVGWFGPRGLASMVFVLLAVEEGIPRANDLVVATVTTVLFSVVLHGASASFGADRYARWFERASAADPGIAEAAGIVGAPARRRLLHASDRATSRENGAAPTA